MQSSPTLNSILQQKKHIYELELRYQKYLLEKEKENKDFNKEQSPYLQLHSSLYENSIEIANLLLEQENMTKQDSIENEEEEEEEDEEEDGTTNEPVTIVQQKTVPEHCIPIRADVRYLDWKALGQAVQFDVVCMDPPWQLASSNPTRGVAIGYKQLIDKSIEDMRLDLIQKEGFLFIWVINAKYTKTLSMIKNWGYTFIDEIIWIKRTVNRRLAKGHGFYLQHAKETCLVAKKGNPKYNQNVSLSDIIFSERRGQSQKPEEIYELIEQLVPNGKYLEIFARKNNLRNFWVSIGNEL